MRREVDGTTAVQWFPNSEALGLTPQKQSHENVHVVCVFLCVYMRLYVCVCAYMLFVLCVPIHVCMCMSVHVYACAFVCVSMFACACF